MATLTATTIPTREEYDRMAEEYMAHLPLEHFMERSEHARQRDIAVSSFVSIAKERPDIQLFSELLVQYPRKGHIRNGQVVPDNMVVIHEEKLTPVISFSVVHEPCRPFMVMEYVSPGSGNQRKDYHGSYLKYEKELKVPCYLIFDPEEQQLDFFRHNGPLFVKQTPDRQGRYRVPELELELAVHGDSVRYWFRGELVPITEELYDGNVKLRASNENLNLAMQELQRNQQSIEEENIRLREMLSRLSPNAEKQ